MASLKNLHLGAVENQKFVALDIFLEAERPIIFSF